MGCAGSVPAMPRGAFASPDGFVHSSGRGWGGFALGDVSRLVVTGTRAPSPAQALRERKTGGILAFQDRYDSSLFCAPDLLQYLTVRFFPDS